MIHLRQRVAAVLLAAVTTAACAGEARIVDPPGSFAFAVMGDAPYYPWEENQFDRVLAQQNASDLAFVISVGDILWRPCSDEMMRDRLARFATLRHPLIYTPGDNEWTDCHLERVGAFAPLDRLQRLREIFFADPGHALGAGALALESQALQETPNVFVENARWWHEGVVFATVHMVGSANGTEDFAGRSDADDQAVTARTAAAVAWLAEAFAEARTRGARAVVLATHADMDYASEDPEYRRHYDEFLRALEAEVAAFAGPVLLLHGDRHEYVVDQPLRDRANGRVLANFTRMEVMGSPFVGWVRVVVTAGPVPQFTFQPQAIPRWMIW